MRQYFTGNRSFSSLSIADLLEAQDAYHVHLAHLRHVVATAVGRFRIRDADPDFKVPQYDVPSDRDHTSQRRTSPPRTLSNTVVRPWSWPCLLVFVDHWMSVEEMRDQPTQVVPRYLYLPDGRVVPTCVLYSETPTTSDDAAAPEPYPDGLLGGGCPTLSRVQGQEHTGTVACLVTDGDLTYALTNRHVAGPKGRAVYAVGAGGDEFRIGRSAGDDAGKVPFSTAYPGWAGARMFVNLDAGLVKLKSLAGWTTQVYGVGELDEPVNLNIETLSLDLIGCPLKARGGASGDMDGRVQALFYRYRSVGGADYVSDLLIGPRFNASPLPTRPGDSGTLWVFDEAAAAKEDDAAHPDDAPADASKSARTRDNGKKKFTAADDAPAPASATAPADGRAPRLRPVAVQWGGHVFVGADGKMQYPHALATFLSTVCRALDVEVVRDWNIGHSEYWGQLGHYKIATAAIDQVKDAKLKAFLNANLSNISFDDQLLSAGKYHSKQGTRIFPLADVPDLVWKAFGTSRKALEHPNHFADMDQLDAHNVDLLKLTQDPKKVDSKVWHAFYQSIGVAEGDQGLLPFRVWQIFDAMVQALTNGDAKDFLIAAGTLAHYVGDSCQPLHISENFDGRNESEKGVHSAYETTMLDRNKADVVKRLNAALTTASAPAGTIKSGHDAAVAVVAVMRNTFQRLSPDKVIDSFNQHGGDAKAMWADLGPKTVEAMASGVLTLAAVWTAAWKLAGPLNTTAAQDPNKLADIYHKTSCLPSMWLSDMVKKKMCTLQP